MVSFFTDLNQGMLPYVPLLLGLAALAILRAARTRDLAGLGARRVQRRRRAAAGQQRDEDRQHRAHCGGFLRSDVPDCSEGRTFM